MPLEIKELHIKASVSDENGKSKKGSNSLPVDNEMNQEIIAECVEKIMEILKDKMER